MAGKSVEKQERGGKKKCSPANENPNPSSLYGVKEMVQTETLPLGGASQLSVNL